MEKPSTLRPANTVKDRIAFNRRLSTIGQLVRDVSEDGARMRVENAIRVRGQLDLVFERWKPPPHSVVKRRSLDSLSVEFVAT